VEFFWGSLRFLETPAHSFLILLGFLKISQLLGFDGKLRDHLTLHRKLVILLHSISRFLGFLKMMIFKQSRKKSSRIISEVHNNFRISLKIFLGWRLIPFLFFRIVVDHLLMLVHYCSSSFSTHLSRESRAFFLINRTKFFTLVRETLPHTRSHPVNVFVNEACLWKFNFNWIRSELDIREWVKQSRIITGAINL